MKNPINLYGSIILLTGSSGFLGKYFTDALREAGGTVITSDITGNVDKIMDITSQESIDNTFTEIISKHKKIDIVINNAAVDPKFDNTSDKNRNDFTNYPEEAMQQSIDVNLMGTWRVCKTAIRHMQEQKQGNIVNISSFYGVTPPKQEIYPENTEKPVDYPITKAAIIMLTRHIASQFGRQGIRSNALAPGGVIKNHDEEFQQKYSENTSLGRMNTPEEIAQALIFICSEASSGMTGETLVVDSGWRSR